jgi:hypothetical protein
MDNRIKQWKAAYNNELFRNHANIALMGELLKRLKSNLNPKDTFVKLQIYGRIEVNKHLIYMPYDAPKKTKYIPLLFEYIEPEPFFYNIEGENYQYQFTHEQIFRLHKAIFNLLPNTNTKMETKQEKPNNGLRLVKYSEKAYAIFGETKPLKDKLKDIGGKFNPYLKENGEKSPGWIFSAKKLDQLNELVN